ncbi:hypothetical protein [Zavarzinia sp. CC-PAN008]|uniref:hypothetical protein n=1 Tax=Zavarzinia sp. CC-PAN008 TaxID=3243332 RepID=UPI003F7442A4
MFGRRVALDLVEHLHDMCVGISDVYTSRVGADWPAIPNRYTAGWYLGLATEALRVHGILDPGRPAELVRHVVRSAYGWDASLVHDRYGFDPAINERDHVKMAASADASRAYGELRRRRPGAMWARHLSVLFEHLHETPVGSAEPGLVVFVPKLRVAV